MSRSVGVHEAKTHLSRLLREVASGEEVVPAARLVTAQKTSPRTFGLERGRFVVPDDFDAPLEDDVLADFEPR